ncbi:MAG: polyheme membrane-associated cytochrome C, partial [Candidatus Aminicenantes bacterium]|nr:polyheme membrane-associated cytochrome C [Candidatus Aminicenantes bacterium]
MIKKPHLILAILIIAVSAVYLVGTSSDSQMGVQSKVSHIEELWSHSGHADATAEAFVHWDEDGEIPSSCSKCHSTPGYVNFIENDGATITVPTGTTVECQACHSNPETGTLRDHSDVKFPSGTVVDGLGPEALCMECHQGRASGKSVDASIEAAGVNDDTPSSRLRFINIHYYAAAATQFGTVVTAGYEYSGKMYDARFAHVTGYNACNTCHNPHSLHVD